MQIIKGSILLLFIALAASCSQTELPSPTESESTQPFITKEEDEFILQENVVSQTGEPESHVLVEVSDASGMTLIGITDENGECTFSITEGTYEISLSKDGISNTYVETIISETTLVHIL